MFVFFNISTETVVHIQVIKQYLTCRSVLYVRYAWEASGVPMNLGDLRENAQLSSTSVRNGSAERIACVTFVSDNPKSKSPHTRVITSASSDGRSRASTPMLWECSTTSTSSHTPKRINSGLKAHTLEIYSTKLAKEQLLAERRNRGSGSSTSNTNILPILKSKKSPQTRRKVGDVDRTSSSTRPPLHSLSSRGCSSNREQRKASSRAASVKKKNVLKRGISKKALNPLKSDYCKHANKIETEWMHGLEEMHRQFKQEGFDLIFQQLTATRSVLNDTQEDCRHRVELASQVVTCVFTSMNTLLRVVQERAEDMFSCTAVRSVTPLTLGEQCANSEQVLVRGLTRMGAHVQSKQTALNALRSMQRRDGGGAPADKLSDTFEPIAARDEHQRSIAQVRAVSEESCRLVQDILQQIRLSEAVVLNNGSLVELVAAANSSSMSSGSISANSRADTASRDTAAEPAWDEYAVQTHDAASQTRPTPDGTCRKEDAHESGCGSDEVDGRGLSGNALLSRISGVFEQSIGIITDIIARFAREYETLNVTAMSQQKALHDNAQCVELATNTLRDTVANADTSACFTMQKYHELSTELRSRMRAMEEGMAHGLSELLASFGDLCVSADSHFVEQPTAAALAILAERKETILRKYCGAHERYAHDLSDGLRTIQTAVQQLWEKYRCGKDAEFSVLPPPYAQVLQTLCSRDYLTRLIQTLCANADENMIFVMHWIDEYVARQAKEGSDDPSSARQRLRGWTAWRHRSANAVRRRQLAEDDGDEGTAFFSPKVPVPQAVRDCLITAELGTDENGVAEMCVHQTRESVAHESQSHDQRGDGARNNTAATASRWTSPGHTDSVLRPETTSCNRDRSSRCCANTVETEQKNAGKVTKKEGKASQDVLAPCPLKFRPLIDTWGTTTMKRDVIPYDYHFWLPGSGQAAPSALPQQSDLSLTSGRRVHALGQAQNISVLPTIVKPPPPSVPPRKKLIQQAVLSLTY